MSKTIFRPEGGAYINELIRKAVEDGMFTCTVTGNWEIEQTVQIPSGFTLVLDGCHLRMKDGTMCNMFANTHLGCTDPLIKDYDICIEGRGRAILDGGEPNGLNERSRRANPDAFPGIPHVAVNSLMLFAHVDGIRIHGLHLRNQRYWAMTFVYCCRGLLRDLDFRSNDTRINEDGEKVHGLIQGLYEQVCVKNSDGIDLRCGCHDFIIENITGFTQDDSIALTALFGAVERKFWAEGSRREICNVIIRNVNTAAYCANIRLLNGDGIKLHDVLIDGVFDASRDCRFMDDGRTHVRIGDTHNYGREPSKRGEVYNITVKNIHSTGQFGSLEVACFVESLHVENIYHG